MESILKRVSHLNLPLAAILLLGLGLRLWGISFGLPYTYAPDEPTYLTITLRIIKTGDLNPHWWFYPSLMFYLNAIGLLAYFLVGRVTGIFNTLADIPWPQMITMGVGKLAAPQELLVARGMTALFGTAAIVVVYLIGRRLHPNGLVALLAGILIAISPTVVDHSQGLGPDIFALFVLLVSFLFTVRIVESPMLRNYLGAGVGTGLAIASKYNTGLILIPLLLAHFLRHGWSGLWRKELYISLVACALSFVIATPYSVLDFAGFWEGVQFQAFSYSVEGHAGQEGNALQWYLSYLWQSEGWMSVLGAVGALYLLATRSKKNLVILSFPLIYFFFISQLLIRNARTVMLIIPFLSLFSAMLIVTLYEWLGSRQIRREIITAGLVFVSMLIIAAPLRTTLAADYRLTQIDSRETARVWLEENLPVGARVAQEAYTPYIDPKRFVAQGVAAIVDNPPDWYVQNGFEYLVFSEGMYGRFYAEPDRYKMWVDKYNEFFLRFAEIKRFNDNNYEIRIYKTGAVLLSHRVAARFGNYGEFVELVGYDLGSSKWMPGEPLSIKLFWRTLRQESEPLELTLRLLDKNDHEIGSARGDLFQGKGWPEGIFSTEWTIPAHAETVPGMYRLDVGVVQSRFNYRTPVKNWAGDDIGPLFLGPFKMSVASPSASELQAAQSANVHFGDQIVLMGYVAKTEARAGTTLPLTFYWQALAKPPRDYTVFVHLLDGDGKVRAQVDAQPRGGVYPTSIWDAGEIIRDDYSLTLPGDLAPGSYRLEIGLYEYPSLARLSAADANGHALGDHWTMSDRVRVTP